MPREVIVPGARDLIPPQGRVTLQLTNPDTGRIVHQVQAENMLMNCWLAQVNQHYRGALDSGDAKNQYIPVFSPVAACNDAGFTRDNVWSSLGRPGIYPGWYSNFMPWLWASDKNVSPLATRTVPPHTDLTNGNFTGYARLDLAHTGAAGRDNRGTVVPGESWHKYAQSRATVEFTTGQANGTYRSIGIGRLASHYNANRCASAPIRVDDLVSLRDIDSQMWPGGGDRFGAGMPKSASFEDNNNFWFSNAAHNLYKWNFQTNTALTGPLSAAITPGGGTNFVGLAIQGGFMWLSRGSYIHKCNKFTSGSLTILNSYNLATPLGAEIWLDITTDGTSIWGLTQTKVFQINPADGTVTTSWVHGLGSIYDGAGTNNIEWDPTNQHLWVWIGADDESPYNNGTGTLYNWNWTTTYSVPAAKMPNTRVVAFSTAGVQLPYSFHLMWDEQQPRTYCFTGLDSNGWCALFGGTRSGGNYLHFINMASMMGSHALLPSDLVKTSANGLKIVYDFDFS